MTTITFLKPDFNELCTVRHAASKDEARPVLGMINIKKAGEDKISGAATNGYIMIEKTVDAVIEGDIPEEGFLIPARLFNFRAVGDRIWITIKDKKAEVSDNEKGVTGWLMQGYFPDFSKVYETCKEATPVSSIALNTRLLNDFKTGINAVRLEFYGKTSPIVVYDLGGTKLGCIMPIRQSSDNIDNN